MKLNFFLKKLVMRFALIFLALVFFQCKNEQAMPKTNVKIHAFRLKPGQDLKKEIADFTKKENIAAGWIMACVGSLTQTNIRYANQPSGAKMTGHFEILSLDGTLGADGLHLHISVADSLGRVTGGHLLDENLIYTTAEIVIGESHGHVFAREKDGTTEWPELQVRKKE